MFKCKSVYTTRTGIVVVFISTVDGIIMRQDWTCDNFVEGNNKLIVIGKYKFGLSNTENRNIRKFMHGERSMF